MNETTRCMKCGQELDMPRTLGNVRIVGQCCQSDADFDKAEARRQIDAPRTQIAAAGLKRKKTEETDR